MARKVLTAKNGRPYILNADGRAEFISTAKAKKAGWSAPARKKAAAPTKRKAAR